MADLETLAAQARSSAAPAGAGLSLSDLADQARSTPATPTPKTFGQSLVGAMKEYGAKLNPLPLGNAIIEETGALAQHPIDEVGRLANSYAGQNNAITRDAEEAYKKADYAGAARHALNYFLNGIPGMGAALEEAGNKGEKGDTAGMLADTAALATQIILGEKAPAIAEGAQALPDRVVSGVKAAANSPGVGKMVAGAGVTAGAVPMLAHEPLAAVYTAGKGIRMVAAGLAERRAAAALAEASGGHDIGFLSDIAGEDFSKLPSEKQTAIRQIADRLVQPNEAAAKTLELTGPPRPDPNFRTGVPPLDPNAPTGTTMRDIVQRETGSQRGPIRPPLAEQPPAAPEIPVPNAGGGGPLRPPLDLERIAQMARDQAASERQATLHTLEPWQMRESELVPFSATRPEPKYTPTTDAGDYSEAALHERTIANRNAETTPPTVPQFPVGTWAKDSGGELMQLREFKLDDPKLIFPEGMPNPRNQTVQKYAGWIQDGSEPPPLTGLETEKGNVKILEGHHRAAAIQATGGDTVKVWVSATHNRPLGNGAVMPEGVTHAGAVDQAIAAGKPVPPEVLADYQKEAPPAPPAGQVFHAYKGHPTNDWKTGDPITEFQSRNGPWAGMFSSKPEVADRFATTFRSATSGRPASVTEANITLARPYVLDAGGKPARAFQFDNPIEANRNPELLAAIANPDYDGIVIKNTADEGDIIVPKFPHQIETISQKPLSVREATARDAKADRFANALFAAMPEKDFDAIETGRLSDAQIAKGMAPRWGNIADALGEDNPSDETVASIRQKLNDLQEAPALAGKPEAKSIAAALRDSMRADEGTTINVDGQSTANAGNAGTEGERPALPRPRSPEYPTASGAATTIRVPDSDAAYQARYKVRELDDVFPSHSGLTFEKNPHYQLANERDYKHNPAIANLVVEHAQDLQPDVVLAKTPYATDGPPVIDANGNVLGGNSRTMSIERAYALHPEKAAAYRQALQESAQREYGIDPKEIAGMRKPVLTREISREEWDRAAAGPQASIPQFNKKPTNELSAAEQAGADATALPPNMVEHISQAVDAGGPGATLAQTLEGKTGTDIVNRLIDEGVFSATERGKLLDQKTGAVTAAAKDRISKMLTGRLFRDGEQIARTPADIRNKLERVVAPLMQTEGKAGWDLIPEVRQAVDLLEEARTHGVKDLQDVLGQQVMFGGQKYTSRILQLGKAIQEETPTALAKLFRDYAVGSRGSMFETRAAPQVFQEVFGGGGGPTSIGKMMQAKPRIPAR